MQHLLPLQLLLLVAIAASSVVAQSEELQPPSTAGNDTAAAGTSGAASEPAARAVPPLDSFYTVPYSPRVRFYSAEGRLAFGYASGGPAFVCDFTGGGGGGARGGNASARNLTYSVELLYPASTDGSIQGRLIQLTAAASSDARMVIACTVSYQLPGRQISEWNILIVDAQAKPSNPASWSESKWLTEKSVLLKSAKEYPPKLRNNTVTCQVVVRPDKMEFAQMSMRLNGARLSLRPTNLGFAWNSADGRLTQWVDTTYLPSVDSALDRFQCDVTDPVRILSASSSLEVAYKAGLRRLHLVNPVSGETLNSESVVSENDSVGCQADVAVPPVEFSWRVMRAGKLTVAKGQNMSLKGVNLFYPVCCLGQNELDGKKYNNETCQNFRGNSTFNTANFFDKNGMREKALICGRRATMGIVSVRYSELSCNAKMAFEAGSNATSEVQCSTQKCTSDTALGQVRRNCKKNDDGCMLDATWLMDPFMKTAIRSKDALPADCFAWDGGMIRLEVDYFCTAPDFEQFDATGVGKVGRIIRYRLHRAGCYEIVARGASGGNHTTTYGNSGAGTWRGGLGAESRGRFRLSRGTTLSIVVGQHGGNSTEISPTHRPSIEDNAGTGGGGGSFVYSGRTLYLAAGGGGGASYALKGGPGQRGTNGSDSIGPNAGQRGRGGSGGSAGWTNTDSASYHGGCGGGWLSTGARRAGPEHGGPGHGGPTSEPAPPFIGGQAGSMNTGAVGGFGGGGGGSEDNGASGGGGGYSGGGAGTHDKQAGGGGGSFCNSTLAAEGTCGGTTGANPGLDGVVTLYYLGNQC